MTAALLFEVWPYAAVILLVGGVIGRALQMRRRLPASPYELGRASAEFGRGRLWRLSLGLLLVAHAVGLAFPRLVLAWNAAPWRLYLLEGLGLLVGLTAAVGCARLIARYLDRPPGGAAAEIADSIFFSLLFVAISSGVATAVAYRWASSWGAATLAPYAASLARGAPSAALVDHLPFLVRVHVVASVTALAALPFSRLALFLVVALHRALAALSAAARAGAARARTSWSAGERRGRDRLAWLWPEGEVRWLEGPPGQEGAGTVPAGEKAAARPRRPERDGRLYESGS